MRRRWTRQDQTAAQLDLFRDTGRSFAAPDMTGRGFRVDDPHRAAGPREVVRTGEALWRPFSTTAISHPVARSGGNHCYYRRR